MIVAEPSFRPFAAAQMMRPLRVLMVTDHLGYANGVVHGASRYYLNVLPRFDASRVQVRLCILGSQHPFAETLSRAGVEPIFFNRSKWDPRALSDLSRLIRSLDVDIVHCLAMKGTLLGRIVARRAGIPALIHLHDTCDPGRLVGSLQRCIAPWTSRALAVSDIVRDYTVRTLGMPPQQVETLLNGLDVDAFAAQSPAIRQRTREELGIAPDEFAIVLAGRVVEAKGQRLMISLLARMLRNFDRIRLLIVGDGPDLHTCRQLAQCSGIRHAITFTGQRSDIPAILAAADAATMPSLVEEGFGYAALEAAAAGKPVAAFAGGAIHRIIDHGRTGFILPRGDGDALAAALLRLATDRELAQSMGQAAAAHARHFSIDRHIQRLEAIYSELANGHGKAGR